MNISGQPVCLSSLNVRSIVAEEIPLVVRHLDVRLAPRPPAVGLHVVVAAVKHPVDGLQRSLVRHELGLDEGLDGDGAGARAVLAAHAKHAGRVIVAGERERDRENIMNVSRVIQVSSLFQLLQWTMATKLQELKSL